MNFQRLIGLNGVSDTESRSALFCSRLLELPMFVAAFSIAAIWYNSTVDPSFEYHQGYDIALWALFSLETGLLCLLVKDKKRYLRENWMNSLIILMGLPLIWGFPVYFGALRLLRIFLLFSLFLHIGSSTRQLFEKKSLGPTLMGSAIIILMAGVIMATIDPGISGVTEGIWWAWVTVTTVGYGDIVPTSSIGRAFAAFLMLIGLGLFSLITASLTATFVRSDEAPPQAREEERLIGLESQVKSLEDKIDRLIEESDRK